MITDTTEHNITTRALERLNRILRTVSAGNEMLVRVTSEAELLAGMCQVVVDGGYPTVWIGFAEHDVAKTVRLVAWAGSAGANIQVARCTWSDGEHGHGPTGTAIRTGERQIIQNIVTPACSQSWRKAALARGMASAAAFPLRGPDAHESPHFP